MNDEGIEVCLAGYPKLNTYARREHQKSNIICVKK